MKILHLISSLNPKGGGVAKAVRDIIFGISLIDKNIVNEVVCLDNLDDDFIKKDKFKIYALGQGKTAWNYNPKLYLWLKKNRKNYDKFIVHGLWQYNSFATNKLFKKTKLPYFVMPHGMLDPYFQKAKERKFKAFRNNIIWKLIENKLVKNAECLLFTCEEEKLLARQTFKNYFPKNEQVVGLGIEAPPAFAEKMTTAFAEKVPQWNGKPFILFLSRINEKKGVDLLIKAHLNLLGFKNLTGLELPQLIIAGPLESNYAKQMQKLANSLAGADLQSVPDTKAQAAPSNSPEGGEFSSPLGRLGGAILFSGMLEGDAKWGAFYNCECFVLPSHQENFGIAIVEAMACRKPVLISNKVNIWREIVESGGGLVENDTEEGTYNLLKKYFSLPQENKNEMGENAFRTYQKYFSIEKSAERMLKVLIQ